MLPPRPLVPGRNLGDLTDAVAARTNLGLGTAATQASSAFDAAGAAASALTSAQAYTASALAAFTGSSNITTVGTLGAGSIPYSLLTGTPTVPSAANPTGTIGLTAVNGSASTFLRSDGAPALSQAITPTWTGLHTFQAQTGAKAAVFKAATTTPDYIVEFQANDGTSKLQVINGSGIRGVSAPFSTITSLTFRDSGATFDASYASNDLFEMAFNTMGVTNGSKVFRLENRSAACYTGSAPEWQFGDGNTNGFWLMSSNAGGGYGKAGSSGATVPWGLYCSTSTTHLVQTGGSQGSWIDPTHATRTGRITLGAYYTSTYREAVRIDATSTGANVSFFGAGSWGGGVGTLFFPNATTNPGTNPTGGGVLYVDSGALKYRGSGGTVTTIAAA